MFRKKKKEFDFDEERLIDLDEFDELEEEDAKSREMSIEEYEKNFIYQIDNGCPICNGEVRGNDHYRYFCKSCNLLFRKNELRHKGSRRRAGGRLTVRTRRLSDEQKKALQDKKLALMARLDRAFGSTGCEEEAAGQEPDERKAPGPGITEHRNTRETADEPGQADDEPEGKEHKSETEEEKGIENGLEEEGEPLEEGAEEKDSEECKDRPSDLDAIAGILRPGIQDAEFTEDYDGEEGKDDKLENDEIHEKDIEPVGTGPEYELEDEDRIIASKESIKIHKGDCHFVKKIHPENRIYFDSIEEGEDSGYELCVCLRRLIARRKAEEDLRMSDENVR